MTVQAAPIFYPTNAARTGVLFMLLGMLMFSLNDVMGKWLVSTYSVSQLMTIRSVAALIVLVPFFMKLGWRNLIKVDRPWLHALRSLLFAMDASAFYFAVAYMPLADAMTYWLAAPIYVAAASPFLLGEKVGWRRWTAILIGFAGVLLALEPSSKSFSLPALIALAGSAAFAFALLLGRTLRSTPDTTLIFWQLMGALIFSLVGVGANPAGWAPMDMTGVLCLSLLGIVAMLAHVLVSRSLKLADAATVVPLQYTLLFWAVVFGWIFFGDTPRWTVIIGAGLIVASGLFIFFREQQLKKQRSEVTEVV
ncbi:MULTISPECIES: DMT family transporter [unclassified Rhizobium]|uniref:DMT family transporter n=1 Tax=unclassified Rhizobium TaxID=2613769 RepID=UPI000712E98E|nr:MULTISPECIES: DMT family transporter [unclassified Rhizobium]KQS87616.1 multidrug DMT transporter permease [Rhizobium sp. Leaf391]KQT07052.1 multidrug DMT transporter permease [Rhizobium sp. Leaf386]KQT95178.1 multidrug DMT transporter permease [Rhizobium sp. Leaf453]